MALLILQAKFLNNFSTINNKCSRTSNSNRPPLMLKKRITAFTPRSIIILRTSSLLALFHLNCLVNCKMFIPSLTTIKERELQVKFTKWALMEAIAQPLYIIIRRVIFLFLNKRHRLPWLCLRFNPPDTQVVAMETRFSFNNIL